MKVFLYWLISLTIPSVILLVLPLLTSADTIYFKDGKRVHVGRTWKEDGQVKWASSGITIGYPEEDVERVEKTPIKEDPIGTRPIEKKKIKKGIKSPIQTISKSVLQSKGVRIGDGLVLKGVSKSSKSIRVVVEANKKKMVKCEAYDSNDNPIGTRTSIVEPPLHEITIKTYNKTDLFKSLKCWSPENQTLKTALQKQAKTSNRPIASQSIKEEITAFAKRQYPHDSRMQKYVYQKQTSAYKYMLTANDSDVKEIAIHSYPDDYSMQKYVYGKQLSAKHYMKTVENEEIKRFALKSYSHNYSMQQYVYNKQLAAKQYMETVSNSSAKSKAQRSYPYDYSMQKYVYDKIVY